MRPQLPRPLQLDALKQDLRHLRIVGWRGTLRGKQFQLMPLTGVVEDLDRFQGRVDRKSSREPSIALNTA